MPNRFAFRLPARQSFMVVLLTALLALVALLNAKVLAAQSPPDHSDMQMEMSASDQQMEHMGHGADPARMFLMGESSGTALQPSAWPMPMVMTGIDQWQLMWMGEAYLVDTQQTGPLGADKLYSVNWGMLSALHRLGGGNVMLRTMLSLEP